jgi:hypothetical protein
VVITKANPKDGETVFYPIDWNAVKGTDSVGWGSFIGSHCAKRIPKAYKVSQKKVMKAWVKNGCP